MSLQSATSQQKSKQVIIDAECCESIRKTVRYILKRNMKNYISECDVDDAVQSVLIHIWVKKDIYDPSRGASFKTWATTIAHNYTIQLSKKLQKHSQVIKSLCDFDSLTAGQESMDYVFNSIVNGNTSLSWINDNLGHRQNESSADYIFDKQYDDERQKARLDNLENYLECKLNKSEKQLLQMMKDERTKEEMMELLKKSSGNIDTCKSRLRSKISKWMKESDYYGD